MEKCVFGGGGGRGGGEVSFVLHLVQSGRPHLEYRAPCTLALLKSSPPPPPPPPSASHLKQTLWTACMTFQLCGWHKLFLQRLLQHTGLLKPSSPGEPPPSWLHHPQAGAQLRSPLALRVGGGAVGGVRGRGERPSEQTLKSLRKIHLQKVQSMLAGVRRSTPTFPPLLISRRRIKNGAY